jgi:hypothetical protein
MDGLLGGIIDPFGQAKLDIINAIITPLGYAVGNAPATAAATWMGISGRSFSGGMDVLSMLDVAEKMYSAYNEA